MRMAWVSMFYPMMRLAASWVRDRCVSRLAASWVRDRCVSRCLPRSRFAALESLLGPLRLTNVNLITIVINPKIYQLIIFCTVDTGVLALSWCAGLVCVYCVDVCCVLTCCLFCVCLIVCVSVLCMVPVYVCSKYLV